MELIKSHWVGEGEKIRLAMPIAKVDEEKRQVSGFATLDNVDSQDDIVEAVASKDAFARFRGNIREMHQPIAAGRLVDFKEDSFYDRKTNKFYRGVYVTAYVSKGAQDTWEKVLDGTLTGFSIGGSIVESENVFDKSADKPVRRITKFDLIELSLVDNPANQLANVDSVFKMEDGIMKGMVAETTIENVFWCVKDEIAKSSSEESETCLSCGATMQQIGWVEKGEDVSAQVSETVAKFLRQGEEDVAKQSESVNGEGGVDMTDELKKNDEGAAEEVVVEAPVEGDAEAKADDEVVVETEVEADFEKMFDNLRDSVNESLEKSRDAVTEAVEKVEAKVAEVSKAFDEKTSEFEKGISELRDMLDSRKSENDEVAKRLEILEAATAIKKSGDVETTASEKKLQKGLWSGTFFDGE